VEVPTVTVAVPNLLVSSVDLAVTVKVAAVSSAATVKCPLEVIVFPATPSTSHVTVLFNAASGSSRTVTVALNCCVPPGATIAVAGVTFTPTTVGSSLPLQPNSARVSAANRKRPKPAGLSPLPARENCVLIFFSFKIGMHLETSILFIIS
jgi:hypothetical protein